MSVEIDRYIQCCKVFGEDVMFNVDFGVLGFSPDPTLLQICFYFPEVKYIWNF
jgi:hypothetical protein